MELPENGTVALDFDLTCALRLLQYDNKRDYQRLESLIRSIDALVMAWFGKKPPKNDDDDDPEVQNLETDSDNVW